MKTRHAKTRTRKTRPLKTPIRKVAGAAADYTSANLKLIALSKSGTVLSGVGAGAEALGGIVK
jgi:hypothetical protein